MKQKTGIVITSEEPAPMRELICAVLIQTVEDYRGLEARGVVKNLALTKEGERISKLRPVMHMKLRDIRDLLWLINSRHLDSLCDVLETPLSPAAVREALQIPMIKTKHFRASNHTPNITHRRNRRQP